ncbi:MAG: deaminase [Thermoleophilia bacterium]|nr:deaminase [Thermoleophilia bacterium]
MTTSTSATTADRRLGLPTLTGRLQYFVATSIDGFLAADDHGLDWLLQFDFAEFQPRYDAFRTNIGALVMGARTYEFIVAQGIDAWTYGATPCWVMTHGEHPVPDGADVTFVEDDAASVFRAATAAAGDLDVWLVGGGDVAAQFARTGLIDDLVVTIVPVLLGSGKRLHPDVSVLEPMHLVDTHRFASGAIELRYEVHPQRAS